MLAAMAARAHRAARKLLRPLDRMAREMRAVGLAQAEGARYEDRLRDLETAIERIRPTRPDERIETGAKELTGLENAVHGLLVRMRESYRQQAQFVSDASHELRTPIAVIQGYAHLLARWGKDDAQVLDESIAAIQAESDYGRNWWRSCCSSPGARSAGTPSSRSRFRWTKLIREVCEESAMIDPLHRWRFREPPAGEDAANRRRRGDAQAVRARAVRKSPASTRPTAARSR